MWNNRRSLFLLVYVKQRKKMRLMIPLALPVLEVTLDSLLDSLEFWENIFPGLADRIMPGSTRKTGKRLRLSQMFTWCSRFLHQLRHYRTLEILRVDDGESLVSIRLL